MKASSWNQFWEHKEVVSLSPDQTYEMLLGYYKKSSKSFRLITEYFPSGFRFQRGSYLFSVFGIGIELWCKHFVDVAIQEIDKGKTQIIWNINMKLFGLQAGANAIVEECKATSKYLR
ncbi:hypothetical protein D3OALGA1CA_4959 [Olavius algarvensis associated proteobacterium Delta 3]|nr:hypothetical protein D3OALGA1CA_4959 [Olavius algarvensis associated proteobacterium Delta 3]